MLRRQCTREYKIEPIERAVRSFLGVKRVPRGVRVEALIGISWDEVQRMKPSRTPWVDNRYPLVDARLTRRDCLRIAAEAGLAEPKKSACVFCPFHDDKYWLNLRDNHPEEFARAVAFDVAIRDMSKSGIKGQMFLHRSLKPLQMADFRHDGQVDLDFGQECGGVCGV